MKYGALRIYRSSEYADYQKSGYFYNIFLGCPIAEGNNLMPFFYAFADTGSSITISSFYLEQIDSAGNLCNSYALTASWVVTEDNDQHKIMKYLGNQNILGSLASYNNGFYRYKITVSSGKSYYSSVFLIKDYKFISVVGVGDFDHSDFDPADFY